MVKVICCSGALLACQLLLGQSPPAGDGDIHVATDGNDSNPGNAGAPFATVTRARDAVRAKIARGLTGEVRVVIHGGVYPQSETLSFDSRDSGTAQYAITYAAAPGETVVLNGGRKITGWKKGPGAVWRTEIPEVKAGRWYFRALFVNGTRAIRARTPNADSAEPWVKMASSTASADDEDKPVTVKLAGYRQPFTVQAYHAPSDVELVYINNNDEGRKRLGSVDADNQTLTLATPNRWNSKTHKFDWTLSFPEPRWKACFLENALEMLDEPGEWYLDRATGTLSYWPRPGENLAEAEVVAPVLQDTMVSVTGTRNSPVINLHLKGISIAYVDWQPPDYGYMGLFCCTLDRGPKDRPEHGFMDAALEYRHARNCSFTDGGVVHAGGMGICLRQGTADIRIEGNDIGDLGGGGIGVSEIRQVPMDQRPWNPMPLPGDYERYRIANNHIHDCGADYFGADGITLLMAHDSVIEHNLIHDTAYSGIQWSGDFDPALGFTRNNTVAYNHIYRAMKVTVDGAGLYVTYTHSGATVIRGNLIHDTLCNPFHRGESDLEHCDLPCHGLYLDGNMSHGQFEDNVVFDNAGGPLLFSSDKAKNGWRDNLFMKTGQPPEEFIEVAEAAAGLEPRYQKALLGREPNPCVIYTPAGAALAGGASSRQFDLPAKHRGCVEIILRPGAADGSLRLKLEGVDPAAQYSLKVYQGLLAPPEANYFAAYKINLAYVKELGDMPILSNVGRGRFSAAGSESFEDRQAISGQSLSQGVELKLAKPAQIVWIAYEKNAPSLP